MTCHKGRYKTALSEHEQILNAIVAKDANLAETAILEHMDNTKTWRT
jgi:DNA-binding FadR family transcriptional regulator